MVEPALSFTVNLPSLISTPTLSSILTTLLLTKGTISPVVLIWSLLIDWSGIMFGVIIFFITISYKVHSFVPTYNSI